MESALLTVVIIKSIHHYLQHVNVRMAIKLITINVSQSVVQIQFGKLVHASVMLDTSDIMVLVDSALQIPSLMLSKQTVSANQAMITMDQLKIHVLHAPQILLL